MSQFTVDGHALIKSQLPLHRHGMVHTHSSVSFTNINHDTSGDAYQTGDSFQGSDPNADRGAHEHGVTISPANHYHKFPGDDHLYDGAHGLDGWDGAETHGRFDWDFESGRGGDAKMYRTTSVSLSGTVTGEGRHGHDIRISNDRIANAISSVSGDIPSSSLVGTDNTQTGDGQNTGLAQGPSTDAAPHTHGTSGEVTLDNRTHDHTIDDITPPWIAIRFMYKL